MDNTDIVQRAQERYPITQKMAVWADITLIQKIVQDAAIKEATDERALQLEFMEWADNNYFDYIGLGNYKSILKDAIIARDELFQEFLTTKNSK